MKSTTHIKRVEIFVVDLEGPEGQERWRECPLTPCEKRRDRKPKSGFCVCRLPQKYGEIYNLPCTGSSDFDCWEKANLPRRSRESCPSTPS